MLKGCFFLITIVVFSEYGANWRLLTTLHFIQNELNQSFMPKMFCTLIAQHLCKKSSSYT